jgi:hypothetical protein
MFKNGITKQEVEQMLNAFRGNLKPFRFKDTDDAFIIIDSQANEYSISKKAANIKVDIDGIESETLNEAFQELVDLKSKPINFINGFTRNKNKIKLGGKFKEDIKFSSNDGTFILDCDSIIDTVTATSIDAQDASLDNLSISGLDNGFLYVMDSQVISKPEISHYAQNGIYFKHNTYKLGGEIIEPTNFFGKDISFKNDTFSVSTPLFSTSGKNVSIDATDKITLMGKSIRFVTDNIESTKDYSDKVLTVKNEYGDIELKPIYSPIAKDENGKFATSETKELFLDKDFRLSADLWADKIESYAVYANNICISNKDFYWTPFESWTINNDVTINHNSKNGQYSIEVTEKEKRYSSIDVTPTTIQLDTDIIKLPNQGNGFVVIENGELKTVNQETFSLSVMFNTTNYGGTLPSFLIFADTDITDINKFTIEEGTYKIFGTFGFTDEVKLSIVDEQNKAYFVQEGKNIHLNNYITYLPAGNYKIAVTSNQPTVYLKNQTNFITIER